MRGTFTRLARQARRPAFAVVAAAAFLLPGLAVPAQCPRPRTDCRRCRKSHRCGGEYFHVAEGRGDAQQHHAADAERRSAIGRVVPRLLQSAGPAGRQSEPRARSAAGEFAGLRFRDRFLRHRGHQQSRDRRRRRDHRDLQRRIAAQGRAHRQGSEDRYRVAARQAREAAQGGEVRRFGEAAARRVGGCHRQSVQPRRHRDGRHRVGPQPRHPVRPLRQLHPDRCRHQPWQFGRAVVQSRRRSDRRQHRDHLAVRRFDRNRIRGAVEDRDAGDRSAQAVRRDPPRLARRAYSASRPTKSPRASTSSRRAARWWPASTTRARQSRQASSRAT